MQRIAEDVALRLFYAALDGNEPSTPLSHAEANCERDEALARLPTPPASTVDHDHRGRSSNADTQ